MSLTFESYPIDVKDYLTNVLALCKYVIFSKPSCPECTVLKSLIRQHVSINDYRFVDVSEIDDTGLDAVDVMQAVVTETGAKSYPICFVQGIFAPTSEIKKLITTNLSFDTETTDF